MTSKILSLEQGLLFYRSLGGFVKFAADNYLIYAHSENLKQNGCKPVF
jgi:hypothetical protein